MALAGAVFCISGTLSVSKSEMTATLKGAGATVAASFTKKVTHLLSSEQDVQAKTAKVIKAMGSGTPIVLESFVGACVAAGKQVPTAAHIPSAARATSAPVKRKAAPAAAVAAAPPAKKAQKAPAKKTTATKKAAPAKKSVAAKKAAPAKKSVAAKKKAPASQVPANEVGRSVGIVRSAYEDALEDCDLEWASMGDWDSLEKTQFAPESA